MTVCVSVKVSEGLVLAADSTAAIVGSLDRSGQSESGILKTYDHVRKLSHIKDYPIGTLSWGTALVGARSVESIIKEYEYTLRSLEEEEERIKIRRMRGETEVEDRVGYSVKEIAGGLAQHFRQFYEKEFSEQPEEEWPPLGILVSGYSAGEFFPEQWLVDVSGSDELIDIRPDKNGVPQFGAHWFGLTDSIVRLHTGRDDQALDILSDHFDVPPEEIRDLLKGLEYPVLFDGMPLQDAVDYAVYLVNVTIGRFRFVVGAPLCGGEIDVAVMTPNAFTWVQRKAWRAGPSIPGRMA